MHCARPAEENILTNQEAAKRKLTLCVVMFSNPKDGTLGDNMPMTRQEKIVA
jgi:hypothetical protein